MAFKFALIAAVCIAQAFATPPARFSQPTQVLEKKPPCNPISELTQDVTLELVETMQEMDDVRETVSMAVVDAKGNNSEVIIACFKEQHGLYMQIGKKISGLVNETSEKLKEELGENYEKYGKKAQGPLKTIGMTMKTLPEKMWVLMKDKEFSKALEVMRESRKTVQENSRVLVQIIREMAQEYPEPAKKAQEMGRKIREESRQGCQQLRQAFRKCVQEGGPKQPIEDDSEVYVQVETNVEEEDVEEENVEEENVQEENVEEANVKEANVEEEKAEEENVEE